MTADDPRSPSRPARARRLHPAGERRATRTATCSAPPTGSRSRRPLVHAARRRDRRLRAAAGTARAVTGGVRPGELPRHGQRGDGRRPATRRRPLRRRRHDRRDDARRHVARAPRRRGPRHALQLRRRTSAVRPIPTRSGGSSTVSHRSVGTSCCTSTPPTFPRTPALLDRMPCPYVIDHMARVPVEAGIDQAPFQSLAEAARRRTGVGEDLRGRAPHRRRSAAVRRRRAVRPGAHRGGTRPCPVGHRLAAPQRAPHARRRGPRRPARPTSPPTRRPATRSWSTTRSGSTTSR